MNTKELKYRTSLIMLQQVLLLTINGILFVPLSKHFRVADKKNKIEIHRKQ